LDAFHIPVEGCKKEEPVAASKQTEAPASRAAEPDGPPTW